MRAASRRAGSRRRPASPRPRAVERDVVHHDLAVEPHAGPPRPGEVGAVEHVDRALVLERVGATRPRAAHAALHERQRRHGHEVDRRVRGAVEAREPGERQLDARAHAQVQPVAAQVGLGGRVQRPHEPRELGTLAEAERHLDQVERGRSIRERERAAGPGAPAEPRVPGAHREPARGERRVGTVEPRGDLGRAGVEPAQAVRRAVRSGRGGARRRRPAPGRRTPPPPGCCTER